LPYTTLFRARSAWAVGFSGTKDRAVIERWNGTVWKQVPTPSPQGSGLVRAAATSASNVWAVGGIGGGMTLIERWNGATWTRTPSLSPGSASLSAVAAISASNAWAVGTADGKTLIEHWNGISWK
jgi:hypothetical protein